ACAAVSGMAIIVLLGSFPSLDKFSGHGKFSDSAIPLAKTPRRQARKGRTNILATDYHYFFRPLRLGAFAGDYPAFGCGVAAPVASVAGGGAPSLHSTRLHTSRGWNVTMIVAKRKISAPTAYMPMPASTVAN